MKRFLQLVSECLTDVRELMPWDLEERLASNSDLLVIDVREPYEFDAMHIAGSLNVPRGILESACEWEYEETMPELVQARDREIARLREDLAGVDHQGEERLAALEQENRRLKEQLDVCRKEYETKVERLNARIRELTAKTKASPESAEQEPAERAVGVGFANERRHAR